MATKIKVVPLAEESFGIRSMCTYVETSDVRVLLDAGASLGPNRFRFPPHPKEYKAMAICREKIGKAADKADVVTVSHYHFDHHTPSFTDWVCNWSSGGVAKGIYEGKLVLVKNYRTLTNFSQRRRGWMFKKTGGKYARKLEVADGRTFEFGDTKLKFSDPVFHGHENSELGWVLMTTVECGDERILFASDVQGPMCEPTSEMIIAESPRLVIIGGPPTYLSGFRVPEEHIQRGLRNLESLVQRVPETILEHHLLRDERWRELSQKIFGVASKTGHKVVTAAEFVGEKNNLLESRRKELYESEPPEDLFQKWLRVPVSERKKTRPPI
jgi:predicted metallo-beta-lactamase superfamily hydrolase